VCKRPAQEPNFLRYCSKDYHNCDSNPSRISNDDDDHKDEDSFTDYDEQVDGLGILNSDEDNDNGGSEEQ